MLLSLDKINPSDDSVYVNSYSDPYSDSDITQNSSDSENHLIEYFQENPENLITAIVNMIIDIPKNKNQYIKILSNLSDVHNNINISTAQCIINPNTYSQLTEILKDTNQLNLLMRARKIIILLQQSVLFDSFDEEIIIFHQQLKKLSNQSLIDSLSSSLINSLCINDSKPKLNKNYSNIKWILFIGGTIALSFIIVKLRK
jgi:hypothetical protein